MFRSRMEGWIHFFALFLLGNCGDMSNQLHEQWRVLPIYAVIHEKSHGFCFYQEDVLTNVQLNVSYS